jgi:hypothetical protein
MSDIPINPVTRRVQFTGNTGLGPFAFTFNIYVASDIAVYRNAVLLTLTTDYTVTIAGNGTGSVTLTGSGSGTTLTLNDSLTIVGARQLARTTDFVTAGDLLAVSLNEQLDSNVIMSQQLDEKIARSIKFDQFDTYTTATLPAAADRADKIIRFDVDGELGVASAADFFGNAVLGANYVTNTATGTGSQVAFGLTVSPGSKNNVQVYIDGVYQNKASFSISAATITFSEAPPLNSAIEFIIGQAVTEISGDSDSIDYTQGGTGSQQRTLTSKLQESVTRNDFSDDASFTAEGTSASTKLNQIDFYLTETSGANSQILPTDRGLVFTSSIPNKRATFNSVPNGTPTGTNEAYSVTRLWAQDIVNNPTASRQAFGMETHYDTDKTMRSRISSRSEGSPTLKHLDHYWQFNGNNCFYLGTARGGIGASAVSLGFMTPEPSSFKTDFSPTTGVTTLWAASTSYSIGDEVALLACDYVYLECTSAGTSGLTEPTAGKVGSTGLSDGGVVWEVHSRMQVSGADPAPPIWMDEDGTTGFGTMNPLVPFHFAGTVKFDEMSLRKVSAGIAAAGVSSLDNSTLLTSEINQVSTVAVNAGVRLPTAVAGLKVCIKNDGANTLKVWPFSGDNLGAGVNTNTTLAATASAEFVCYDATNWFVLT